MRSLVFVFLLLIGCANKEYIFVPTNSKCLQKTDVSIGIDVRLPYYMGDLEIMELKNMKLISTNKYLSKTPKEIIIEKLSNTLCDPNIFVYPWEKKPKYVVKINIDDFYFKENKVFMNARIYINSKFLKVSFSKVCKNEYNCINDAFDEIVNKIKEEI